MKAMRLMWPSQGLPLAACLLLSGASISHAQISTQIPTVTIQAADPYATWSGNPGIFTVVRHGNPLPPLLVYYQISGTASNGVDYQTIGNFVSIPGGVYVNDIVIKPIDRGQVLTKTVTLTLTNSPMMNPVNYGIGSPSSATVWIAPGLRTNVPPLVSIAYPADGAVFYTKLDLPLVACAKDLDGLVTQVEFFANGVSLGVVTNSPSPIVLPGTPGAFPPMPPMPPMPPFNPFVLVWSNVPPGTNVLLAAKATDNDGASTLSAPVSITVHPGPPPTPTNLPPVVRITSPPDGAIFRAPVIIPIFAYAADKDGFVTGVEFFAGTTDLGPGRRVNAVPPPLPPGPIQPPIVLFRPTNYWELLWTNAPQGAYALTAVATDNRGLSAVSDAVNVTILPPLPPPTNRPPIVSITAPDPIAIEGTNCWPCLGLAGASPTWANWTATSSVRRYLTNCGPKNAIFAVRRLGETNADLAVTYDIGGTATNGVDYVSLPGVVTIPAGRHVALITLVPIDDGPPDLTSTVILKLTPSPNYKIGRPPSAAALILDSRRPWPVTGVLPDKTFHLGMTGPDGAWFHIEYSTDLLNWLPISGSTNQVFGGGINFIDQDAPGSQVRFYRAVPEANPPAE